MLVNVSELQGKTFDSVVVNEANNEIRFKNDSEEYVMNHFQSCCESVYIEEIIGDINDLQGVPLLMAEETINEGEGYGLLLWTFYRFRTIKGDVTIRWLGESNGYYSVNVDLKKSEQ